MGRSLGQTDPRPLCPPQEKDVTPDPKLLEKVHECGRCLASARHQEHPLDHLSPELSDVFDFFIALTICNTVVVTSPDQPRQKASSGASVLEAHRGLGLDAVSVFLRGSLGHRAPLSAFRGAMRASDRAHQPHSSAGTSPDYSGQTPGLWSRGRGRPARNGYRAWGETGTERPGGARGGRGWGLAASVLTRASERGGQAGAQGGAAWTCTVTIS